jgi:hypothetical protein
LLKPNPLHLVLWEPLFCAVVEFGRARAFVRRHFPRVFERAAFGKVTGRRWRMLAGIDFGLATPPPSPYSGGAPCVGSCLPPPQSPPPSAGQQHDPQPRISVPNRPHPSRTLGAPIEICAIFRIGVNSQIRADGNPKSNGCLHPQPRNLYRLNQCA